ncbi:MAG TPA: YCF48-related protein, partial [Bacteroidia bacterium]|nr:YCF48-related protein [Bacteroidia bacterium]
MTFRFVRTQTGANLTYLYIYNFVNIQKKQAMKLKFTLLIIIFFSLGTVAQVPGWILLNSGTTIDLIGIKAVDNNTAFVCGASGLILKTTDGGMNWILQNSGTTKSLYSINFTSATDGIAVGDSGTFLRTIDGGVSWTGLSVNNIISFRNVYFFDNNIGYVTGAIAGVSGHVFKTTDGGATWDSLNINSGSGMYGLTFTSVNDGFCSNFLGGIFTTNDGGVNWTPVPSGVSSVISDICFTTPATGFAIGANGVLIQTINSGASWTPMSSGVSDWLSGLDYKNGTDGFITGGNVPANTGVILQSTNGGASWTTYPSSTPRLLGVDFADSTGYTVGLDGTIMKHTGSVGFYENNSENEISIYPNPVSDILTLSSQIFQSADTDISICDDKGALVFQQCFNSTGKLIR